MIATLLLTLMSELFVMGYSRNRCGKVGHRLEPFLTPRPLQIEIDFTRLSPQIEIFRKPIPALNQVQLSFSQIEHRPAYPILPQIKICQHFFPPNGIISEPPDRKSVV